MGEASQNLWRRFYRSLLDYSIGGSYTVVDSLYDYITLQHIIVYNLCLPTEDKLY